jgi:epoxyqueuosine reductase
VARASAAIRRSILELASEGGFDLVGIAPLRPPRAAERFEAWLAAGRHADMGWLEKERARILDPRLLLGEGRSLLIVGWGHSRPSPELPGGVRVARYALGRDYHNTMGKRLRRLAAELRVRGWLGEWKKVVDAGPLLERSHAAEAGLGFESKAANLLQRDFGPYFFLGELVVDLELEPTLPTSMGSCGTCTACLDACPTQAILEPGVVDARRCISYQTIENRGAIPLELRPRLEGWTFGCDVCSEVCPWARSAPDLGARLGSHSALEQSSAADWVVMSADEFHVRFRGSPIQRTGQEGWARNSALALAKDPREEGRDALLSALENSSALVREAAHWALATAFAGDAGIADRLARAQAREVDPQALAEMQQTLLDRPVEAARRPCRVPATPPSTPDSRAS